MASPTDGWPFRTTAQTSPRGRGIELTVYVDNTAAEALYAKFGFEREGPLRRYTLYDGGYVDVYAMARLQPETEVALRLGGDFLWLGGPYPGLSLPQSGTSKKNRSRPTSCWAAEVATPSGLEPPTFSSGG